MVYRKTEATLAAQQKDKDRIVAAAIAVIAARGIDNSDLAMIAKRAHVSSALIYKHFADRNDLLAAAIERLRARDSVALHLIDPDDPDALSRAVTVIYGRMWSPWLNAFAFGSLIYRVAIREALERILAASGLYGPKGAKIASAAIIGALRGIADASEQPAREQSEALRVAFAIADRPPAKARRYSSKARLIGV